jgi:hypothetical protein
MKTYTVRPKGLTSWADGIKTLREARRLRQEAIDRGLSQPVYIIASDGSDVTFPTGDCPRCGFSDCGCVR